MVLEVVLEGADGSSGRSGSQWNWNGSGWFSDGSGRYWPTNTRMVLGLSPSRGRTNRSPGNRCASPPERVLVTYVRPRDAPDYTRQLEEDRHGS